MDKNKFFGLLIIGLIALGAVFYVAWLWLFNNGQVIVEGLPPFNVSIGGNSYVCLEQQCLYKLGAREYSYSISKEGYFDQSGYVDIERGKTVIVSYEAAFEAKPLTGVDYPMLSLPVGYSKFEDKLMDISLFHLIQDKYQLSRMPKKIDDIEFSPSGEGAILFEDELVSYYNTQIYTSKELDVFADAFSIAWTADESAVYSVVYDEASKKDALVRLNLEDGTLEKSVYFLRDINEYWLCVSPDERFVALADLSSNTKILYLIDLEEASRTNVFEGTVINKGVWSRDGNYYVFEGNGKLWMMNSKIGSAEELGFNAFINLVSSAPNEKFYFVSTQDYSLSGSTRPYFSNFDEVDETLMVDEIIEPEVISLHVYNIEERQTYLVLELLDSIPGVPEKIEVNEEGGIIRMLVSEKYFDVKIME